MKAVLFANGTLGGRSLARQLSAQAPLIIAVDGGIRHCAELGVQPHVLLGDLDSAPIELVSRAAADGVLIEQHPKEKDKTDLELALDLARSRGAQTVALFGALGGRPDMSLANLLLPAAAAYTDMRITLYDDQTRIDLLRGGDRFTLTAAPGGRVSLLPVNGPAEGVTLTGFLYNLNNHTLNLGSTRGISNTLEKETGCITVSRGLLLCVQTVQTAA